jgi:hypothetical protein
LSGSIPELPHVAKLFGCRLQDLVLSFGRLVGRARRCGVY